MSQITRYIKELINWKKIIGNCFSKKVKFNLLARYVWFNHQPEGLLHPNYNELMQKL